MKRKMWVQVGCVFLLKLLGLEGKVLARTVVRTYKLMHGVFLPHSCHISRMYIPDTTSGKYIMICFRVNFGTSLHLLQTALHCLATYS